jgi:hypothetical protein
MRRSDRLVRSKLREGAAEIVTCSIRRSRRARDFVARLRAAGWTGRMLWVPISFVALGLTAARAASSLCRGRWPDGLAVWSILRPRRYETRLAAEILEAGATGRSGRPGHRGDGQPGARNGCERSWFKNPSRTGLSF